MDVQKTMEFILEQQAAAVVRQAQLETRMAEYEAENQAWFKRFESGMSAIQQTQLRQLEMIDGLVDESKRQRERLNETQEKLDHFIVATERRFNETQEKLDALISVVDGIVRRIQ